MNIINLTQHAATAEQIAAGVVEPCESDKVVIQNLLTFDTPPSGSEIKDRAKALACIATRDRAISYAMIGGAPYLMSALESALRDVGISPLYAFTERVSVEEKQADGSVIKRSIFRHAGFVTL